MLNHKHEDDGKFSKIWQSVYLNHSTNFNYDTSPA